ncbi:MAG: hypothetical protein OWT28_04540 [Firmicutes bacterium]|nr:hypothetical protein [Bacillota bacterium]
MADDQSFDLNAATWRHGHADEATYVEALAMRLEKSLPGIAVIERDRRLFSKTHKVTKIEVRFGAEDYVLTQEHTRYVARLAKTVRGIVLSSQELPLSEWLQELSAALADYARQNDEARRTLMEFLL